MKKHLLGLAIFSFIFASFAVLFAFLYAPQIPTIPQVEEIQRPVFQSDRKYYCNKRADIVGFEVLAVNYDLDGKKLVALIKMDLGNNSQLPQSISVSGSVSNDHNIRAKGTEIKPVVIYENDITRTSKEAIFTVVTEINAGEIDKSDNLYAHFNFIHRFENTHGNGKFYYAEPKPILFDHGTDSIIRK